MPRQDRMIFTTSVYLSIMLGMRKQQMFVRCVHDTLLGAFIMYSKDGVQILIYENVGGKGRQTRCIDMQMEQLKGGKTVI